MNLRSLSITLVGIALIACQQPNPPAAGTSAPLDKSSQLDTAVPQLLESFDAAGAGIGIISNGELMWTGFYGEQAPDKPINEQTVFNLASVAKTVTAETLLALADKDLIDIDEPIFRFVSDSDLSRDPRFEMLTTRLLLAHQGGLLNWPYEYDDGRAAFIANPGTSYSYSGMGIDLAAKYAENKLGQDFETLAFEHLLKPAGIIEMSLGRIKPWMADRLAQPMNADGEYFSIEASNGRLSDANNDGGWSGADDLLSTVSAYAEFLTNVMGDSGKDDIRQTIQSPLNGDPIWDCQSDGTFRCANEYGHSFGWMVYKFDDRTILKHGGNDAGENSLVLYSPESRSGVVIMINGGNGIFVSTQILGLLDTNPDIAAYYRALIEKFYGVRLEDPLLH